MPGVNSPQEICPLPPPRVAALVCVGLDPNVLTIVLVGYGTGTVPGTNGLRYEYDSLYTSIHEYARFSIENVLLSVALRTCTPHHALYA